MSSVKRFWHIIFLPCEHATHLASQAMDGPLSRSDRLALRLHLVYCTACRRFVKHLRFLRDSLRRAAQDIEQGGEGRLPGLSPDARQRLTQALSEP